MITNKSHHNTAALIMAGGKGTRLTQRTFGFLPKPLVHLNNQPLIDYVLINLLEAGINNKDIYVLVNYQKEMLIGYLQNKVNLIEVKYPLELGNIYSLLASRDYIQNNYKKVLVCYGDMPLIKPITLNNMLIQHHQQNPQITILTNKVTDPDLYDTARVIRNPSTQIIRIVEQRNCTTEELKIKERNVGPTIFNCDWLYNNLGEICNQQQDKELFLTNLIELAAVQKESILNVSTKNAIEATNINTLAQLQAAEQLLSKVNSLDNLELLTL